MTEILSIALLGFAVFVAAGLVAVPFLLGPSKEAQRAMDIISGTDPERREASYKERLEGRLLRIAQMFRGILRMQVTQRSVDQLAAAGYRDSAAPDVIFAIQCLLPLAGVIGASRIPENTLFWMAMCAGIGYIAPNFVLTGMVKRRRERIRRSLPDTIDLLVICVDAGLGLDQALMRVSNEIAAGHPDLQGELARVHLEQRAGRPRLETWQNMAARTKVPEISSFVNMLTQADRFGTPIAKTLSTFADDMRAKRRQRAEEAAAKAKIKIIFPLVFFIFPCLFIVLLGPALLEMSSSLKLLEK
jgi:tight adherence protein C